MSRQFTTIGPSESSTMRRMYEETNQNTPFNNDVDKWAEDRAENCSPVELRNLREYNRREGYRKRNAALDKAISKLWKGRKK